jgi:hypothetical protein
MKVKEMIEFLSQFDEDTQMCVLAERFDERYLDITSISTDDYEGNVFIVINANCD